MIFQAQQPISLEGTNSEFSFNADNNQLNVQEVETNGNI
jgi:hypothetical protein